MVDQRGGDAIPGQGLTQEGLGALGQLGHDGLQVSHQHAEQVDTDGADRLQLGICPFLLGDDPGGLVVHIAVGLVGQGHDLADGAAELARFVGFTDGGAGVGELGIELGLGTGGGQFAAEALGDKAGVTGG